MRALRVHAWGGADQLKLEELPVPAPGPGEVRIKVTAIAVNPVDWKIRDGLGTVIGATLPFTLGCEGVGTIDALGDGVTGFAEGQRVWAFTALARGGWYAEYVIARADEVALAPPRMEDTQAAALPVALLTAGQALDRANANTSMRVLVHGGAGGIGSIAIQILKDRGAEVFATASARNQEFLKSMGADHPIDYGSTRFEEIATDIDVVFDTVGGETLERSYAVLKRGGRLATIAGEIDQKRAEERGIDAFHHFVQTDGAKLLQYTSMADMGIFRPTVAEIFRLADAPRALAVSESGRVRGKLILVP